MTGESNRIPGVVEMQRPIEEFVGSASFEVVRKAHCPVTIVRCAPRWATAPRETGKRLGVVGGGGQELGATGARCHLTRPTAATSG